MGELGVERASLRQASSSGAVGLPHTVEDLMDVLVEAHGLWRRSPGSGRWPFAGDGPWHLIQGEAGDYAGEGQDGVSAVAAPRPPLDAGEVAQRDRAALWLGMIEAVVVRRAVHQATLALFLGEPRVPWKQVAARVRWERTPDALAKAVKLALARVLCVLHGWPDRRARELVRGDGLAEVVAILPWVVIVEDGPQGVVSMRG